MKPYHPGNLRHQPYSHVKVILLAWVAKFLGIQFKIEGLPFGASKRTTLKSVCGNYSYDAFDWADDNERC